MSKGYGPLADRPDEPAVGLEVSHESADLHVVFSLTIHAPVAIHPRLDTRFGSPPPAPTPA